MGSNIKSEDGGNRIDEYDISKGFAILLVVLGHLLGQTFHVGEKLQIIITFCHMPVFFFISGFFIYYSLKKHPQNIVLAGKMKKLAVPYIFWSFISFGTNIVLNSNLNMVDIKSEFVEIFINARSVWFLVILLISSCISIGLYTLSES